MHWGCLHPNRGITTKFCPGVPQQVHIRKSYQVKIYIFWQKYLEVQHPKLTSCWISKTFFLDLIVFVENVAYISWQKSENHHWVCHIKCVVTPLFLLPALFSFCCHTTAVKVSGIKRKKKEGEKLGGRDMTKRNSWFKNTVEERLGRRESSFFLFLSSPLLGKRRISDGVQDFRPLQRLFHTTFFPLSHKTDSSSKGQWHLCG